MMDPVAICNVALGLLGANTINTLDQDDVDSTEEELCANLFESVTKMALEERAWLFATGTVNLGAIASTPSGEVERIDLPYRFALPEDTIAIRGLDDGSGQYQVKFEKQGQYVLCDTSSGVIAIITRNAQNPQQWSPTFCMAVAYKLASLLAVPLTHNAKLMALYEEEYQKKIKQAAVYDGMQGTTTQQIKPTTNSLSWRR